MGNRENNIKKPGFKTLSIHHGETFSEEPGCVMPPIFSTSTFKHGNKDNFDYTRSGNPNFRILENILKSIEDSKYCTVFGSGISAVTAISSTLNQVTRYSASQISMVVQWGCSKKFSRNLD